MRTRHHACSGARQSGSDRPAARGLDGHHTAVRLHDEHLTVEATRLQRRLQPGEIQRQGWLQIGVQYRRGGAFEFANFRKDVGTDLDVLVFPHRTDRLRGRPFVGRVGIAVHEDYCDGLGPGRPQICRRRLHRFDIHRRMNAPVRQRPLRHLQAHVARHNGFEAAPKPPRLGTVAPPHFQHIAEPRRGDNAGRRPLAFQQCIGARRRPMHHRREIDEVGYLACDAVDKASGTILRGRRHLGDLECPFGFIEKEYVRESAADIDADDHAAPGAHVSSPLTA